MAGSASKSGTRYSGYHRIIDVKRDRAVSATICNINTGTASKHTFLR